MQGVPLWMLNAGFLHSQFSIINFALHVFIILFELYLQAF